MRLEDVVQTGGTSPIYVGIT